MEDLVSKISKNKRVEKSTGTKQGKTEKKQKKAGTKE